MLQAMAVSHPLPPRGERRYRACGRLTWYSPCRAPGRRSRSPQWNHIIKPAFSDRPAMPRVHGAPAREGAMSKLNIGIAAHRSGDRAVGRRLCRCERWRRPWRRRSRWRRSWRRRPWRAATRISVAAATRISAVADAMSAADRGSAPTGFQPHRAFAVHNVRANALNSRAFARTMRNAGALRNPGIRARIAAGAAVAGWHDGHVGRGWWQTR